MKDRKRRISLGKRLRSCPSFSCCGVEPNWVDYPGDVQDAVRDADEIYYPTVLYETIFESEGKRVFPGSYYSFVGHKIRQTFLFQLLESPTPEHASTMAGTGRSES